MPQSRTNRLANQCTAIQCAPISSENSAHIMPRPGQGDTTPAQPSTVPPSSAENATCCSMATAASGEMISATKASARCTRTWNRCSAWNGTITI